MRYLLVLLALTACSSAGARQEPSQGGSTETTPTEPSGTADTPDTPPASPAATPTGTAPTATTPATPPAAPPAKGPDGLWHLPDPSQTPGVLCTAQDPNFDAYVYPAQIAHCVRNVSTSEKDQVGAAYGIDPSTFSNFEFDHYIPLSIGGSDDIGNIWPQPLAEAQQKDVVEEDAYNKLKSGTITQAQAVAMIKAWRPK